MTDSIEQQHNDDLVLLYGAWYEVRRGPEGGYDRITFQRQDPTQMGWGQRFVFDPDGTFADIYSARCGNDEAIHHWVGHWQFDAEHGFLTLTTDWTSPDEAQSGGLTPYPNGHIYSVDELKQDVLVLRQPLPTDDEGVWSLR